MLLSRVVVLGAPHSGKTSLIELLGNPEKILDSRYKSTIAVDFCTMETAHQKIQLWDSPGNSTLEALGVGYLRIADLMVYCVDLSDKAPFDDIKIKRINDNIEEFQYYAPGKPVILVGTHLDTLSKEDADKVFLKFNEIGEALKKRGCNLKGYCMISAKDNTGVKKLRKTIFSLVKDNAEINNNVNVKAPKVSSPTLLEDDASQLFLNDKFLNDKMNDVLKLAGDSLLKEKLEKLQSAMIGLPRNKYNSIADAAYTLVCDLQSNLIGDKAAVINKFESTCNQQLASDHPVLKAVAKAVAVVAIMAFVTVITALVGFGIGFAAGAWTGPGAFISGVAAGTAAACAVVGTSGAAGLIAGALGVYSLFKPSPVARAVHDVAKCARDNINDKPDVVATY